MRNVIAIASCLLTVTSCVKSIDLTSGDRMVVVECILQEEAPQTLRLGLTTGPTGIEKEALERAEATLTDLTEQKIAGVFKRADDWLWHLDYAAIPEHKYRLEVEVPGYGTTVWAEDTMPAKVDIVYVHAPFDQLEDTVVDKEFFKEYFYHESEIPASWKDSKVPLLELYGGPDIKSIFYQSASLPEHTLIQGFVYNYETKDSRMVESLCTDSPGVDNCNLDGSVFNSPRRYLPKFLSSASEASSKEEAIGLAIVSPRADGCSNHRRFLKIEREKALSQEYFTVAGGFRQYSEYGFPPTEYSRTKIYPYDFLLFGALSDNYNAYMDDAFSSYQKPENLASLYMQNNTHSNIKGGVGILGAITFQMVPLSMMETVWELYDFKF